MSSANNFVFDDSGCSMESWGTPALTSAQAEIFPLGSTLFFLFLKKLDKRFKRLLGMLFCFSLKIKPSWHTLSKALDMSRNILRIPKPYSNDWYISEGVPRFKTWLMLRYYVIFNKESEHVIKSQSLENFATYW